ncbi:MAG: glutaredoxin family protein [Desulfobacterales bacterium]|nr:glutaredoxin family protein [Desulfobacterales bacterium]
MNFKKLASTPIGLVLTPAIIALILGTLFLKPIDPDQNSDMNNLGHSKKIVIFTTAQCRYCDMAKAFFKKNHIDYLEIDLNRSEKVRRVFQKVGGRGVPLIFIDDIKIDGFIEPTIRAVLKQKGLI